MGHKKQAQLVEGEIGVKTVNFVLMGKGGVGKSLVASLLSQYWKDDGKRNPYLADTDPTNSTLAGYEALGAEHINISDEQMGIDKGKFDDLIEKIVAHDGDCVVDTGASSFLPMMSYLLANQVFDMLAEQGYRILVHTPLVGGQGMDETIRGLQSILQSMPACKVVVWENEYFGPVEKDGLRFASSAMFTAHHERVHGIVHLERRDPDTYGRDILQMTTERLTFEEALASPNYRLMQKQRLTNMRRDVNDQLRALSL